MSCLDGFDSKKRAISLGWQPYHKKVKPMLPAPIMATFMGRVKRLLVVGL